MDPLKEAKSILVWYFKMLAEKTGIQWNSDNECEVENSVDEILRAAGMETNERIKALQAQIDALEGRLARIEAAAKSGV